MKCAKVICLMLVGVLCLSGCHFVKEPEAETGEPETTLETTAETIVETVASDIFEQILRPEPLSPKEPYTMHFPREGRFVYQSATYESRLVDALPHGKYTIVEEANDPAGRLWGKLKSGKGWVCLENVEIPEPNAKGIYVAEADATLKKLKNYTVYRPFSSEYVAEIFVQAMEPVSDIEIYYITDGKELVQTHGALKPGEGLLLYLEFPGDVPYYQISYRDSRGVRQSKNISENLSGEGPRFS